MILGKAACPLFNENPSVKSGLPARKLLEVETPKSPKTTAMVTAVVCPPERTTWYGSIAEDTHALVTGQREAPLGLGWLEASF